MAWSLGHGEHNAVSEAFAQSADSRKSQSNLCVKQHLRKVGFRRKIKDRRRAPFFICAFRSGVRRLSAKSALDRQERDGCDQTVARPQVPITTPPSTEITAPWTKLA